MRLISTAFLLLFSIGTSASLLNLTPSVFIEAAPPESLTGIEFPSNGGASSNANSTRFRFTGALVPPIYGTSGAGLTYLWKIQPIQQTGYYTTFFWANDDGGGDLDTFLWSSGAAQSYYGAHPYPHDGSGGLGSSGTQHRWEISIEQVDTVDADDAVVKGVWYSQALRAWGASGVAKQHEFYWALPDVTSGSRVTHTTANPAWGDTSPPVPMLTFGDAPWQPNLENCSCILRGLQIYDELLTTTQINQLESLETDAEVLAQAASMGLDDDLWYLNMNPTPDDITDKSGNGRDPTWLNSNHGTLWTQ